MKFFSQNKNDDPMTEPAFQVRTVEQFTFTVDDSTLACILRDIANVDNPDRSVNIRAYLQIGLKSGLNSLKIVPGVSFDLEFEEVPEQTQAELNTVRRILDKYDVNFTQETVLFVSAAAVAGQLFRIQTILNAFNVDVIASYIDESTFSIYHVSNNAKAIRALTLSLEQQDRIIEETLQCDDCLKSKKNKSKELNDKSNRKQKQ